VRRFAFPVAAATLLLALLPSQVAAIPIPYPLDQQNTTIDANITSSGPVAQTFKAGRTGLLTDVQLYLSGNGALSTSASLEQTTSGLPNGTTIAVSQSATPGATAAWVTLSFTYPQPIQAGTEYALVFNFGGAMSGSSTNTYGNGQALSNPGGGWIPINSAFPDFAFRTYVDEQTSTAAWNVASVPAGASTTVKLTETFAFPTAWNGAQPLVAGVGPNVAGPFGVETTLLPTWFTATGVVCSSQIAPADCILANITGVVPIYVTPNGSPITIEVTGTAHPAASLNGTSGRATGNGCANYSLVVGLNVAPNQLAGICVVADAYLPVGAASTPPPTSASDAPTGSPAGVPVWLLALSLLGCVGGIAAVARRDSPRAK
jgi:hypothetical protein